MNQEQRVTVARQMAQSPGGPIAMEIAIHEQRLIEQQLEAPPQAAMETAAPRTPSPASEHDVSPYAPMRKRGGSSSGDVDDLRQELDARLAREVAWEQEVHYRLAMFIQREKGKPGRQSIITRRPEERPSSSRANRPELI